MGFIIVHLSIWRVEVAVREFFSETATVSMIVVCGQGIGFPMKLQCVLVGGVPDRTGRWYRRAAGRGNHRKVLSRPVWMRMKNNAIWKKEKRTFSY